MEWSPSSRLARDPLPPQHQPRRAQHTLTHTWRVGRVRRCTCTAITAAMHGGLWRFRRTGTGLVSHGRHALLLGVVLHASAGNHLRHEVHRPPTAPAGDQSKAKSAAGPGAVRACVVVIDQCSVDTPQSKQRSRGESEPHVLQPCI